MFQMRCSKCNDTLSEPGGLVFSPPDSAIPRTDSVIKYHLCKSCWDSFKSWLMEGMYAIQR